MRVCKREACGAEVIRRKPTGRWPAYCSSRCKNLARADRAGGWVSVRDDYRRSRQRSIDDAPAPLVFPDEDVDGAPVLSYGPGVCEKCGGPRSTYQEPPHCWQCANPVAAAYAAGVGQ